MFKLRNTFSSFLGKHFIRKYCIKSFALIITALIFFMLVSPIALSESTNNILNNGRIKIRVGFSNSDVDSTDAGGRKFGYIFEFMRELQKYGDFDVEFVNATWSKQLEMLKNHELDLVFYMTYTPERAEIYDFSDYDIDHVINLLYTTQNKDLYYEDFERFDGMNVGVLKGSVNDQYFMEYAKKNNFSVKFIYYEDDVQMNVALRKGEVDACVKGIAQLDGMKIIAQCPLSLVYIASYKNSQVLKEINSAMSLLQFHQPSFESTIFLKYNKFVYNTEYTREEKNYINEKHNIRVGVFEHDFVLDGVNQVIVDQLFKNTGIDYTLVLLDDTTTIAKAFDDEKCNIIAGILDDNSRHTYSNLKSTQAYYSGSAVAVKLPDVKLDIDKTIEASIIGGYGKLVAPYDIKLRIHNVLDGEKALDNVLARRVDVAFVDELKFNYLKQKPIYSNIEISNLPVLNYGLKFICKMDTNDNFVNILNKSMEKQKVEIENEILKYTLNNVYEYSTVEKIMKVHIYIVTASIIFLSLLSIILILKKKNMIIGKKVEEADKANAAKTEFLYRVSHDMRTPMNVIIGLSEIGINENKHVLDTGYFTKIKENSEYLLGLLNDLLDLQKMDSSKMSLNPKIEDCSQSMTFIYTLLSSEAIKKKIDFTIKSNADKNARYLICDKKRYQQVLVNVLSNAIKYTNEGGKVSWEIDYERVANKYVCHHTIRDNGVGISEEFSDKLFEPFAQEQNSRSLLETGSGIGLSIVKALIDLMGGSIRFESKLGQGTTFYIDIVKEIPTDEEMKEYFKLKAKNKAKCSIDLKGIKVLVCEDVAINAKIEMRLLESCGALCDHALNGKIAVDMAHKNNYDIILMDIQMPVMGGLEATSEIRKINKDVPIIGLSANAYEDDIKAANDAGMNEYVSKPIDKNELIEKIHKLVSVNYEGIHTHESRPM